MSTTMKKNLDDDMPQEDIEIVMDFLPPPHELARSGEAFIAVTMNLDPETVKTFKDLANKNDTKYQRMMREVLKLYAIKYKKQA